METQVTVMTAELRPVRQDLHVHVLRNQCQLLRTNFEKLVEIGKHGVSSTAAEAGNKLLWLMSGAVAKLNSWMERRYAGLRKKIVEEKVEQKALEQDISRLEGEGGPALEE